MKHTLTPWIFKDGVIGQEWPSQGFVNLATTARPRWHEDHAKASEEAEANAAFIVRAVNAHEEMLTALKWALENLKPTVKPTLIHTPEDTLRAIENAIAKAEAA